jgi:hypothetical protein
MKAPTDQSLTEHTNRRAGTRHNTADLGRQVASVLDPTTSHQFRG